LSGLTDVLAHGGDIKIPLGLPYAPDPERVAMALNFLTGPTPFGFIPRRRLRGICLYATDLDQAWGRGPLASASVTFFAVIPPCESSGRSPLHPYPTVEQLHWGVGLLTEH
jgi:hypothetical protein